MTDPTGRITVPVDAMQPELKVKDRRAPMEIAIESGKKQILVSQRWKFFPIWQEPTPNVPQKHKEEKDLHFFGNTNTDIRDELVINNYFSQFRDAVLEVWNRKLEIVAKDRRTHEQTVYRLTFRIDRVESNQHWDINLHLFNNMYDKGLADDVNWLLRTVHLYLNSMHFRDVPWDATVIRGVGSRRHRSPKTPVFGIQTPVAHEFGHTIGNARGISSHADEYERLAQLPEQEYRKMAYRSVMSIGNKVLATHSDFILSQLTQFRRDVEYTAREVKPLAR